MKSRTESTPWRVQAPPSPATPDEDVAVSVRRPPTAATARDGVHVGIDVGGKPEKGFELCVTHWADGLLASVSWTRVPHSTPLPTTESLRSLVRDSNLAALAAATQASATATAADMWRELERHHPAGIYVDSPSAFSRNSLGHGRLCEKQSLTGVSFQSTPSLACGKQHGGDWGWLVYGMIAFAACLHRGQLGPEDWLAALERGTDARFASSDIALRECFPTATISVLRANNRETDVARVLGQKADLPGVGAVLKYLEHGVKGVKRPRDPLYDQADALVAALGALPHVAQSFREVPNWPTGNIRWKADPGADEIEGTFTCVA